MKKFYFSQSKSHSVQTGFSLIEILISMLVTSIGLLGVAGLQTLSLRQNYGSSLLAQATFQNQNMIERMRSNMQGVNNGDYDNITGTEVDPNCSVNCSATQLADADAANWAALTKSSLNDAGNSTVTSTVQRNADNTFTVQITWREPALPGQRDDVGNLLTFVTNQNALRFLP